jgi:hypothetical protein
MDRKNYYRTLCQRALWDLSKASLNLKGPFGVTNLKVCSQKIVPIFSFFLFGPGQAPKGPEKLKFFQGNFALVVDRKASLNLKGPFGVTNMKVCSQKIVPIFFFFFVWAGTLWALVTSHDFGAVKN